MAKQNSSFIGHSGDVVSDRHSSEEMGDMSIEEKANNQTLLHTKQPKTSSLVASGGRWRNDDQDLEPAELHRKIKTLASKLTVSLKFYRLCSFSKLKVLYYFVYF